MKKIYFLILLLFFTGCADKTGFTMRYYPDCKEEYDYYGTYKVSCPHNIIDYKTIKEKAREGAKKRDDEKDLEKCLQCN